MHARSIQTPRLKLVLQTSEDIRRYLDEIPAQARAEISPAWLALVDGAVESDPWIHGFLILDRASDRLIGRCGFKGRPDLEGVVEIAYGVNPDEEGKGYATEAASELVKFAFEHDNVRKVRAHTLPENNASGRVLTKCGFQRTGEVIDPEDGRVWRWEAHRR